MFNQKSVNIFTAETEVANHVQVQNSKIMGNGLRTIMAKVLFCPLDASPLGEFLYSRISQYSLMFMTSNSFLNQIIQIWRNLTELNNDGYL